MFIGWKIKNGDQEEAVTELTDIQEDVTVYAVWGEKVVNYTVSFNANGGEGEMDDLTGKAGTNFTLPDCEFKAPDGKYFAGWKLGDEVSQPGALQKIPASDIEYVAQWEDYLLISFNANGGSGEMPSIKTKSGYFYNLPVCEFTAPEGQYFAGWKLGDEISQPGDEKTMSDSNVEYIAQWENYVTVSFDGNGGSGEMESQTVKQGAYELPACTFAAPTGHEFKDWKIGEVVKNAGDEITVTEDTIVVAEWKPIVYTISLYPGDGGTGEVVKTQREYGSTFTLPENGFTANAGKRFKNWDKGEVGAVLPVTGDMAITAQWVNVYTVKFDANGGAGVNKDQVVEEGKKLKLPENWFTAPSSSKEFDKWDLGAVGTEITVTSDMTVKAMWKDIPVAYSVVKGADQRWTKYSGSTASFSVERNYDNATAISHYVKLQIDGVDIPSTDYNLSTGTVEVTFSSAFMERIQIGQHTITFVFDDGYCSCNFYVVDRQTGKTGDTNNIALWGALAGMCVIGGAAAVVILNKKGKKETD